MLITSCDDGKISLAEATTPSIWVISEISFCNNTLSYYRLNPIRTSTLNMSSTWYLDSLGKFQVGDTLTFKLQ